MVRTATFAALAFLALAQPALANDSEAEIGIGGIVLKQGSDIVMASEDLFISEHEVRVTYRFENPTDEELRTTVAFPLPGQPRGVLWQWYESQEKRNWTDFAFSTRVDGKLVSFTPVELAVIGTRDVTREVRASGLPMDWYLDEPFDKSLDALSDSRRAALVRQGLLKVDPLLNGALVPAWDVATWFVREQVFPPHASVIVEHHYAPMPGGSVGGALYPAARKESPESIAGYRERYCTDQAFLSGIDRRLASGKPGAGPQVSETWLGYVLSPGANWNGPIRDFRLVVDKGAAENLVSFCMNGVRKLSPTRFEVRKRNFTPAGDLSILIVKFHRPEE